MEDIDLELSQLADLAQIEIGRREKRPLCNRCRRPVGVCWCHGLSGCRVETECRVVVLQHPHEEKRCLRTAPILQAALPPNAYIEVKSKRFSFSRFPQLEEILTSPHSVLMYPGEHAISLDDLPPVGPHQPPYNIIIIDGTWQQAKSMYHNCHHLHALPQVCLSGRYVSKYIIRTQPTEDALSTVETAAIAMATLEQDWSIYTTLLHPLQLLCQYQIKHGAVPHQSKEQMIASGRCRKPMGKRTYKKLRKCGAKQSEVTSLSTLISSLHMKDNQEGADYLVDSCGDEKEKRGAEDNRGQSAVDGVDGCGSGSGEIERAGSEDSRDQSIVNSVDLKEKNKSETSERDSSEKNGERRCQDMDKSYQEIDKLPGFG
ncbi:hypothetical protein Pcinc_031311 [Petrolisthes cinctipes]|uniref:tRNA-uridine aminocarboxypropyltransferase n=1 Tax=Petrolisthes cinctipes TaxID=88211 RepID=A0AAE1K513_PETCI|nr:hypothetical protein Pcinc_031311 [Petrolisthes cinctipes]